MDSMKNRNSFFTKLSCLLIGWNPDLLQHSTEASYKALRRYTSALLILIILWGFTSFMFAKIYLESSLWAGLSIAAVMVFIVICIERQIILKPRGRNRALHLVRLILAVCMAFIGASIIDQVLFQDDIEIKKQELNDLRINERMALYAKSSKERENAIKKEIDSLNYVNDSLNRLISKKPVQKIYINNKKVEILKDPQGNMVLDENGDPKKITTNDVKEDIIANPLSAPRDNNTSRIATLQESLEKLYVSREADEKELRDFYNEKKGFMTEINAIIEVLKEGGWPTVIMYSFFFLFFLALELMILVSSSARCDYDILIEKREEAREKELTKIFENRIRVMAKDDESSDLK